jgi:hypothetical protein
MRRQAGAPGDEVGAYRAAHERVPLGDDEERGSGRDDAVRLASFRTVEAAPWNAGFDSKRQRELRHVTAETKTPGEPGAFTARWSGKRD